MIVKTEVVEQICFRLLVAGVASQVYPLSLQRTEEALHRSAIPAAPRIGIYTQANCTLGESRFVEAHDSVGSFFTIAVLRAGFVGMGAGATEVTIAKITIEVEDAVKQVEFAVRNKTL